MSGIQVSEKELSQFEKAVAIACAMKSEKQLQHQGPANIGRASRTLPSSFTAEDGSLVISFDRGWYPFLCNTRGDNTGPQRWYIPKVSRLIAQVARALQTPMQKAISYVPGGRIFLDAAGVRRTPQGHAEIAVLRWSLPRESPLLCRRAPDTC
ncbi:MAG: hypothetical protein ACREMF_05380 [Gemmatimonadales bacterium]